MSSEALGFVSEVIAMASVVVAVAAVWFTRQQNSRAKESYVVDLYLRLRERTNNEEGVARRARVSALLLYLQDHDLSSADVEFSPDLVS